MLSVFACQSLFPIFLFFFFVVVCGTSGEIQRAIPEKLWWALLYLWLKILAPIYLVPLSFFNLKKFFLCQQLTQISLKILFGEKKSNFQRAILIIPITFSSLDVMFQKGDKRASLAGEKSVRRKRQKLAPFHHKGQHKHAEDFYGRSQHPPSFSDYNFQKGDPCSIAHDEIHSAPLPTTTSAQMAKYTPLATGGRSNQRGKVVSRNPRK